MISVLLNLFGLALLFIGNTLVTYTVGKYGSRNMPHFKIGNTLQTFGFILSFIAILLAVRT